MYVEEYGPADGTPAVFLHGSMVAGWMWLNQVERLPTYRCLLPDLPGIGRSAGDEWLSFSDTADRVAEMIRSRCTNGSAHLVGLSLGGVIGLYTAARHPDVVRSLLVSGVPSGTIPPALRALSRMMLWLYGRPWGAQVVAGALGIPKDESKESFLDTARQTDPIALQRVIDEVGKIPLPPGLDAVKTPTLAVVGTKDTEPARRAVPYLQRVMPNARGYLVPGVGHPWNAEQPELFATMVRTWIDRQGVDGRLMPADPNVL